VGQTDPEAQKALFDDLRRTDPALWPQLVNAYRTSMAYKQQSTERNTRLAQQNAIDINTNGWGNPAVAGSALPDKNLAVASTPNQYQAFHNEPSATQSAATPVTQSTIYPLQSPPPQSLPTAAEGAILTEAAAPVVIQNYPNTHLPEVRLATAEVSTAAAVSPADWQGQLAAAVNSLESQISAGANSAPSAADQAMLRMLYLAAGRRDEALRPLTGVSSSEQEFWGKELAGLEKLFDDQDGRDSQQRSAEAARQLQQAANRLAQSAPLAVRNLAFCTEVSSFGVYKPLPAQSFKPGQQLLLYAEVDNFVSESTDKGYRTSLSSRYEILDSRGARVASEDFGLTEENCRNLRRDFFLRYFLKVPQPLAAGEYTLKLTVDDTAAAKVAYGQISFIVGE
jgi:hypothetical protein